MPLLPSREPWCVPGLSRPGEFRGDRLAERPRPLGAVPGRLAGGEALVELRSSTRERTCHPWQLVPRVRRNHKNEEARELGGMSGASSSNAGDELHHEYRSFTELRARTNAGEEINFEIFKDKVVLVVNVARL